MHALITNKNECSGLFHTAVESAIILLQVDHDFGTVAAHDGLREFKYLPAFQPGNPFDEKAGRIVFALQQPGFFSHNQHAFVGFLSAKRFDPLFA